MSDFRYFRGFLDFRNFLDFQDFIDFRDFLVFLDFVDFQDLKDFRGFRDFRDLSVGYVKDLRHLLFTETITDSRTSPAPDVHVRQLKKLM